MIEQQFQAPIAIVRELQQRQEWKKLKPVRLKRGHTLYQFCLTDGILQRCILDKAVSIEDNSIAQQNADLGREGPILVEPRKIRYATQFKANHVYFGALNLMSAIKRIKKEFPMLTSWNKI